MDEIIDFINIGSMEFFYNTQYDNTECYDNYDNYDNDDSTNNVISNDIEYMDFLNISHDQFFDNNRENDIDELKSNITPNSNTKVLKYDNIKDYEDDIWNCNTNIDSFENSTIISDKMTILESDFSIGNKVDTLKVEDIPKKDTNTFEIYESIKKDTDDSETENIKDKKEDELETSSLTGDKIDVPESGDFENNTEINMQCIDHRDKDILIEPEFCVSVSSKNLDICPNIPVIPDGISDGVIAKIPVVLAQLIVPFHVSSIIDLPEQAIEIKDMEKRLKLTQCMLLQPTDILFIKGFVRKNIEYSTKNPSNNESICGEIHHCTIDVPFECSTAVTFFKQPLELAENTKKEFQYTKEELSKTPTCEEKSEFNQISEEFFNESPFCKLLSSKIIAFDEYISRESIESKDILSKDKSFMKIEEKMVIELKLEILQNQPVIIPPTVNPNRDSDEEKS